MLIDREIGLTPAKLRGRIAENLAQLVDANRRGLRDWARAFELRAVSLEKIMARKVAEKK